MFVFIVFTLCILITAIIISFYYRYYYLKRNLCQTKCFKTTIVRQSNQNNLDTTLINDSLVFSPNNVSKNGISSQANDNNLVHNRFRFRSSPVNYISPHSIYGYAPSKIGNSFKNEKPKATRQFTVKLSPFPLETLSSNIFTNRSAIVKSVENNDSINSGQNVEFSINESSTTVSNAKEALSIKIVNWGASNSKKRPIIDDHEDLGNKKSRNNHDEDDYHVNDDYEANVDIDSGLSSTTSTNNNKNDKTLKRSTNVLDNENQFIIPKKRVRNNEILSSYSSTNSNLQTKLAVNKRKSSPETPLSSILSNNNEECKTKKLTHIEELELMTSQVKPSSYNVFLAVADSGNETIGRKSSNSKNMNIPDGIDDDDDDDDIDDDGDDEECNNDDHLTTEIEIESADAKEADQMIEVSPENDDAVESTNIMDVAETEINVQQPNDDERLYPIPTYVFSIKDHEHDKKKNKNRLNRFMEAVQQANQELKDDLDKTLDTTSQRQLLPSKSSAFQPIEPSTKRTITAENVLNTSTTKNITTINT